MNIEEKEQWLYEEYQYTKNFDFSRLDKYKEANDDICIDDIILDYTMLYEFHKEEIERLNNIIKELEKRHIKYQERYFNEIADFCISYGSQVYYYNFMEHNDRYLKQCYYNLEEKYDRGIITKEEWKKIEDLFKEEI